ncbi:MAG: LuxR C-terminal-related transcriptional regulator [Sporichthyaceae bacterium]
MRVQAATGLPCVFGGPTGTGADGEFLVIDHMLGHRTRALDGLTVLSGRGLGGLALAQGRPLVVNDYRTNKIISHHYDRAVVDSEGLRSVCAFPVRVEGRVAGVIYGGTRDPRPIGDVALKQAEVVVSRLAIDVARAVAEPRQMPLLSSAEALAELESIAGHLADASLRERLLNVHRTLAHDEPAEAPATDFCLAPREEQCLALAAVGATNARIAQELNLSPETVKAYLRSAMRKLNVNNRTGAIHVARSAGLI